MGKLNNINIYFDFDEQAKHNKFWNAELETVCQYYINLISQTSAFHYYNPYVMQDLAYHNKPLDLPLYTNWDKEEHPRFIHLIHKPCSNGIRTLTSGNMKIMMKTASAPVAP